MSGIAKIAIVLLVFATAIVLAVFVPDTELYWSGLASVAMAYTVFKLVKSSK